MKSQDSTLCSRTFTGKPSPQLNTLHIFTSYFYNIHSYPPTYYTHISKIVLYNEVFKSSICNKENIIFQMCDQGLG
jgi:hypothetical protein